MAAIGEQASLKRRRRRSGRGETKAPAAHGRSLLGALLGRGLSWLGEWVAPVGRGSLYVGLVLVALTAIRLPGGLGALADVFLLVSMVCALVLLVQGRALKIVPLRMHAIGLALVVSGVVIGTLARASEQWQSLLELSKFAFATTATIVTCMVLLERRSQVKTALGCWVVSAAVSSLVGLMQAGLGESIGYVPQHWGRLPGLSENPNGLGQIAALAIAGGLSLAATSNRLKSVIWLSITLICIAGVMVSASRAGAIMAIAALAIWATLFYRLQREFTILVLGCCLAVAAVSSIMYVQLWSGQDLTNRLMSATNPYDDGPVASRLYQFDQVLRDSLRRPVVGVGLAEQDINVHGIEIHNTFLMLFRAGGLISLAGILVILGDLLLKAVDAYRSSTRHTSKGLAAAFLAGVIGLILAGMAGPVLYQRGMWVSSALLLAFVVMGETRGARPLLATSQRAPDRHSRRSVKRTGGDLSSITNSSRSLHKRGQHD